MTHNGSQFVEKMVLLEKGIDPSTPTSRLFLTFHGDTVDLLRRNPDGSKTIIYPLYRRASIKDILESLGLPHTEVGRIVLDRREQTFEKIARDSEHYMVYPVAPEIPPTRATFLRPNPLDDTIFLVDINVGRLAGMLRMAGFDAENVSPDKSSTAIVQRAIDETRILLTRNRDLLKRRRLVFGHLVRNHDPEQQLKEIVKLYGLQDQIRPFSRCIVCNGLLIRVEKESIIERLLPLTKKYYHRFNQCTGCGKIYWHGSHLDKMTNRLNRIFGIRV
jgi:uncharacterized protein with PIN domain